MSMQTGSTMVSYVRTIFLRIYSNLPLNTRKEVIVVLGEEPISWNAAYIEIKGNTLKGKEILKKLQEMKII